jgi:hypothetical protein
MSLLDALHDDTKVEALAASLRATATRTPKAAVDLLLGTDEVGAARARLLILYLEELAVAPLLEAKPPLPEQRAALITQAAAGELALRKKLIARLDVLLDDKTPVPVHGGLTAEQRPPPRRVCDEAYVLMRQVVHFGEPDVEAAVQADMFLNAPNDFKDQIIKKARATGVWNRAITGKDVQDYANRGPERHE